MNRGSPPYPVVAGLQRRETGDREAERKEEEEEEEKGKREGGREGR